MKLSFWQVSLSGFFIGDACVPPRAHDAHRVQLTKGDDFIEAGACGTEASRRIAPAAGARDVPKADPQQHAL